MGARLFSDLGKMKAVREMNGVPSRLRHCPNSSLRSNGHFPAQPLAKRQPFLTIFYSEKENCFDSLIAECVRVFLEKKDARLKRLQNEFTQSQSPDEKVRQN